jgi:fatty-acid desaturase
LTAFTFFHVGAVAALFFFRWPAFVAALAFYWNSLSLGIGMGYHRLLTHRSYQTSKWMEYFLAICGTLALEGGPMFWVATQRIHHQFPDKNGDPHTPRDGKWWSHKPLGCAAYEPERNLQGATPTVQLTSTLIGDDSTGTLMRKRCPLAAT